jgi:putative acetyltransferase
MITIREEESGESQEIRILIQKAFRQTEEVDIVDKLRQNCCNRISLVAVPEGRMVGQILFTPATIQAKEGIVVGMGLGPMAVLPEFQRQGIGSRLVKAGSRLVKKRKYPFVIVLGHPAYYPRFGFVPASRHGIKSEYKNAPDEAFMILVLNPAAVEGVSGVAKYRPEFASAV